MDLAQGAQIGTELPEWQDRQARQRIGPKLWGRTHWSLFEQVGTTFAGRAGLVDWDRITVSAKHWPMLWAARSVLSSSAFGKDGADYGIQLKRADGQVNKLDGHCDVDVLMDLVDHGVVEMRMPYPNADHTYYVKPSGMPLRDRAMPRPSDPTTGHVEWLLMPFAKFTLTQRGFRILAELAEYKKDETATWSGFEPSREAWA